MFLTRTIPVACYWLCLLVAGGLCAVVFASPSFVTPTSPLALRLFAEDAALRRTTIVSAAGLMATAFIFFRATPLRYGRVRRPDGTLPTTNDLAGA